MSVLRSIKNKVKSIFVSSNDAGKTSDYTTQTSASDYQTRVELNFIGVHKEDTCRFVVGEETTILELKQLIFDRFKDSLQVKRMDLTYEGQVLDNDMRVSELRLPSSGNATIIQEKVPQYKVSQIPVLPEEIDQVTYEKGVAIMPCGHKRARETLVCYLKQQIFQEKENIIRCPEIDENGMRCNEEWTLKLCKRVGVLTAEEVEAFEVGLAQNWMSKNTKQCPKCSNNVFKGINENKVSCPACKSGFFCFLCLKSWKSGNLKKCGNEECIFRTEYMANRPEVMFKLKDRMDNRRLIEVKAPANRFCPNKNCGNLIQYQKNCKHMQCNLCKTEFCWICLSQRKPQGWLCGKHYEYCGWVAPVQQM